MKNSLNPLVIPNKITFAILTSVFLSLFILRDGLGVNVNNIIFILLPILLFIIGDKTQISSILVMIIVLGSGFQYFYSISIGLFIYLIKFKNSKYDLRVTILVIFTMLFELFHFMSGSFSIIEYFRYLIIFVWLIIVIFDVNSINVSNETIIYYVASLIVCSFAILLFTWRVDNYNSLELFLSNAKLGLATIETVVDYTTIKLNPNSLALFFIVAIASIFSLKTSGKTKIVEYFLVFILVFLGLFTRSRAFLIGFGILLMISAIDLVIKKKISIKSITINLVTLIIIMAITYGLYSNLIESLLYRFQNEDISTRTNIIQIYNRIIFNNFDIFFFGVGMQDLLSKAQVYDPSLLNTPHNAIQDLFMVWGLFGLIFSILLILYIIRRAKKITSPGAYRINYITLMIYIIMIQASRFIRMKEQLFLLIVIYATLIINYSNQNKYKVTERTKVENIR